MLTTPVLVTTTHPELAQRIDAAYERFVALLAVTPGELGVDGSWTAVEVAGHLVNVVNRYVDFSPERLAATPRGVDEVNERELHLAADRPVADVLAALEAEMDRFRAAWGPETGFPLDLELPFHGGGSIRLQAGLTNLLAEFLVHGLDVARAAGVDWPIDPRNGALLVAFGAEILPAYVCRSNTEHLLVRLDPIGAEPWVLDVEGAGATSRRPEPGDEPNVCLRGPATPIALLFYRRLTLDGALADGVEVCGGTHPERARIVPDLFEKP
ncbi:MAG TPA: maleylpyruvate isomerase family mycothiol-dependent enzyme [Acidimicrobiales bacterium]|nr:maleylpyruvate isomerase family mycothiol-dependent enzyme [Acidimicrobiales bacterium]